MVQKIPELLFQAVLGFIMSDSLSSISPLLYFLCIAQILNDFQR